MTTNLLDDVDAGWIGAGASPVAAGDYRTEPPVSRGPFGHEHERRLGLRVPAACWALLRDGERSAYAQTVELSPTGAVLKLLDGSETRFDERRRFDLDIFVPGASRPVHSVAWPVRAIGQLQAFEFLTMTAADRLTLAEHLDELSAARPPVNLTHGDVRSASPPVSWRRFVLSLQGARPNATERL